MRAPRQARGARACSPARAILRGERRCIPVEAGVARLHRLVAPSGSPVRLAIEAPVEVEAVDLVPVALAKRVREAAVDRAAGIEADQVAAPAPRRSLAPPPCAAGASLPRRSVYVDCGSSLIRSHGSSGRPAERHAQAREAALAHAARSSSVPASARVADACRRSLTQAQREIALLDAAGLPHQRLVEAHEVGALGRKDCRAASRRLRGPAQGVPPARRNAPSSVRRRRLRCSAAALPSARSARAAPRRRASSACWSPRS